MATLHDSPKTLLEAVRFFADYDHCHEFMVAARWADGVVKCPQCGSDKVSWLANARVWKCYGKHERPKFSLKVGTIFEDSPVPLSKWLPTVWLLASCKNGISSHELHRALGVTQKTAWFMLHRVRKAMQSGSLVKLGGNEVEVDETFIGGKSRNMHATRRKALRIKSGRSMTGGAGKTIVVGILDRTNKQVRTAVVPDRTAAHMQSVVLSNVERGLHGTYIAVEPFHLFRYVDEQAFRYNTRKGPNGELLKDIDRFEIVLEQIVGKRLTYKELIGDAPCA